MGNLSDSMQTLVDEITAATHNRRHHLHELAQETREALEGWRSELQEVSRSLSDHFASNRAERATANRGRRGAARQFMDETARALGDQFASNRAQRGTEEQARLEATQQLMDEIHRVNEHRRVTVSELRSEAHNLVERFGLEHQDMAEALREKLSSEGNALKEAVRELVGGLAADRRQAHQIWTEGLKKKLTPEAVAAEAVVEEAAVVPPAAVVEEVAAAVEAPPEVETARPLPLEERVLEVIARHPQGVRLVDIGNELGVDWRSLLGISRAIVEEDKVERIDTLYYPKGGGPQAAGEEA